MTPGFVEPPDNLSDFPALEFREPLWRIHDVEHEPWFFGPRREPQRFDLLDVPGQGTCYLSTTPVGAFVEKFGDRRLIPEEEVARKALSRAVVPEKLRLANVTDPKVIGQYGLGLEVSASLQRAMTPQAKPGR